VILFSVYITLLAMLIFSLSPLFSSLFEIISVPTGMKTVLVQALGLVAASAIYLTRSNHKQLTKELKLVFMVWVPLLLYTAMRTDFSDSYAVLKFGKLFFIPFLSVLTITTVYLSGRRRFNRYFFSVLVALSMLQLIEALMNPTVTLYASTLERMTVEGVNPIWLARTFVTAALCCLVLPIKSHLVKVSGAVVFILAVLPTGSRGPLLAGLVGIALYLWVYYRDRAYFMLKLAGVCVVLAVVLSVSLADYIPNIQSYMSRDSGKGVFQESGRDQLFANALDDYMSAPVLGVGFGKYRRSEESKTSIIIERKKGYYPHNMILEILAELGTVGLVLLLVALRPDKWWFKVENVYQILFIVYLIFAMTSGNIVANSGVMIFGALARLAYRYPHPSNQIG
jgi:O-antigen ligase